MAIVVILVGLGVMIWLLARAGVFRAFGQKAPKNKVVTERRAIGDLPDLPVASEFRPVFRYEFLGPLRALGDVADDDEAEGLEALSGCARGRAHGRTVWMYSRSASRGAEKGNVICGVVEVGAELPRLEIAAANAPTLGPARPMQEASAFACGESTEFADAFTVTTPDVEFAGEMLDDPMRRFLLAQNNTWSFGFGGNYAVVRAGELDSVGVERFLETVAHVRELVPQTVRRRFPAESSDTT